MNGRQTGLGLMVVLAALLACKSKHHVAGTITVNGAPFVAKQCTVGSVTQQSYGTMVTTHSITLTDAGGRRLSFSDSGGLRVLFGAGGGPAANAGEGCGTARFLGPPSDPHELRVVIDADCRGAGVHTQAKAEITRCGTHGL